MDAMYLVCGLKVVWHIDGDMFFIRITKIISIRDKPAAEFHNSFSSYLLDMGL